MCRSSPILAQVGNRLRSDLGHQDHSWRCRILSYPESWDPYRLEASVCLAIPPAQIAEPVELRLESLDGFRSATSEQ
jgi:hypothetical protein